MSITRSGGFRDRQDAGLRLARDLRFCASEGPIVLGLPRGGVPVAYQVARVLQAPLDIWIAGKVGLPWHPELGIGAVAEGGYVHLNREILEHLALSTEELAELVRSTEREVAERVRLLRGDRPRPDLLNRTVIVVDDGIATGGTVLAAVRSIRAQAPKAILLAVPVASPEALRRIAPEVERIVCLQTPADLHAIGVWYSDFSQVSDDEVVHLLDRAGLDRQGHEEEHAVESLRPASFGRESRSVAPAGSPDEDRPAG